MLTTDRLILRGAHSDDLDDLFNILSDSRAMQFWSTPPHPDRSVTQIQLDRMVDVGTPITYFMLEMDTRVIGMAGMHHENEIGFILHPDYWRQGILTEAMQVILPYLWDKTHVAGLIADADPRNDASTGFLKSLGFIETHRAKNTFCVNDVWSDSVYFALPRPAPQG